MTVLAHGVPAVRVAGLDRLRGLAVVLMVADHLAIWMPAGTVWRVTGGRLAMPLFFLVAGSLAGRGLRWGRAGQLAGLGLLLPMVVPWIDCPNVLVWLAAGLVLLGIAGGRLWVAGILAGLGLTLAANGWASMWGAGYNGPAVLGLMGLGALTPSVLRDVGSRLPHWLGSIGRHALVWYVLHVLALTVVVGGGRL